MTNKLLGVVAVLALVAGCANEEVADGPVSSVGTTESEKIIGKNDLVSVRNDGANLPEKYRGLVDAFGVLSMGCTATHIGGGIMLTAGHCFRARPQRQDNVACPNVNVKWGVRVDDAAYLTSTCDIVLAMEQNSDRDYAIVKVSPAPKAKVGIDFAARPALESALTIFSHPKRRPLEWSKTCSLKSGATGGWGLDMFSHQCDTEPGSSGATVLSDDSLKVIGIHDGGLAPWNYATYLTNTPLREFVAPPEVTDEE
jgi:V8-like Glu-specific endopeptidase